ncbi:MAG: tRNA (adenosine(37)-N6)-threonylcarbamoyltransferase complex dimerization subunit type 1 TsaB [Candidatus Dactylopiibacterium carminicum]|uniref:tRNA (Adenosine(37)-N6)-threonylcarbamoyltransferase complex dimerization subunit type 1 TsaB n=1 Tax=Candidatus Dactylopiibacterium carminicum TaxID=857335 RepID=A0A272EUR3_9RHOO|nr:tRNA (adenosine(37)-N6)-threonylcarbamoyltransferase complex dimerization subunit type 1 TsaB [Candidatus Dactylopiibacterium carminicum]KAF7600329.1 tRNA (adenosine(37)-N6)-threonylcarbamoyltransferase complex dimerization subunit type 1 TsaB [Candidatus Dactylopiibacterium carminicum]PAS93341.1 MAG: tRNA (adenosine(37)-N6)-threonylcarbamoyltransferase complex dimerization subunit type 1 TsaB [Candidatus Dactylopiibacterium carminicum]PAS93843.1 MAG: tRNA (adenosine(37)-N6)-threonylcarbamoyl
MKILAIESSTEVASLALRWGDEVRSVRLPSPPAHSATLLPALHALLAEAGASLSALDRLACGIGPGAFTGVRLACSVAQGLALGADLPVASVCSLLVLAQAQAASQVYVAMDARMGEVYAAQYRKTAQGWDTVLEPCCVAPEAMPGVEAGWFGAGTAFQAYAEQTARLQERLSGIDAQAVPDARALLELAAYVEARDAALLAPLYVRDRVALTTAERLAAGGRA